MPRPPYMIMAKKIFFVKILDFNLNGNLVTNNNNYSTILFSIFIPLYKTTSSRVLLHRL